MKSKEETREKIVAAESNIFLNKSKKNYDLSGY